MTNSAVGAVEPLSADRREDLEFIADSNLPGAWVAQALLELADESSEEVNAERSASAA